MGRAGNCAMKRALLRGGSLRRCQPHGAGHESLADRCVRRRYSSLVALPDRSIGVLFERGERSPYERIIFARFTLAWLTRGAMGERIHFLRSLARSSEKNLGDLLQDTRRSLPPVGSTRWQRRRHSGGLNRLTAVGDPSREHESFDPEVVVEAVTPHLTVSFAGVDHRPVAFIDPDVCHDRSTGIR